MYRKGEGRKRASELGERHGTITSQHLADESSVYYLLETNRTAVANPLLQWLAGNV